MANGSVAPAFIQKAGHHKKIESMNIYMNPNIITALHTSDILCGNKNGWKEQLVGRKNSLDPFLHPSQVKESDSSFSSSGLLLSLLILLDLRVLQDEVGEL